MFAQPNEKKIKWQEEQARRAREQELMYAQHPTAQDRFLAHQASLVKGVK